MKIKYIFAKCIAKLKGSHEPIIDYFSKRGISVGKNCLICTDISTSESFLISIGDNCIISNDVQFVTHDYSASLVIEGANNLYGRIKIGNNCFIGARSIIMYGVTICDKVVVAAGSVVTKSFTEEGIIVAGNPGRKIGTWVDYQKKYSNKATPNTKIMPFAEAYVSLKNSDRYLVNK